MVPNQIVIILLCLFHRLVRNLKKPASKPKQTIKTQQPSTANQMKELQVPKKDPLQELKLRKKQIESTIQQFNNPSTFAKYSKMKRQLIKLESQIKKLSQSTPIPVNQPSPTQSQPAPSPVETVQIKPQIPGGRVLPQWFGMVFNIMIMCLALTMYTKVLPYYNEFPLSYVTNSEGRVNCIFVYLACKMILF